MIVAEILKSLRVEADLTQSQLAQRLGIGQSTIVGYERGDREPTASNLMKYASYFNVSLDFLTGRTDDFGSFIEQSADAIHLSPEERKLVEDYRGLAKPLKELLQDMIRSWQENTRNENFRKES